MSAYFTWGYKTPTSTVQAAPAITTVVAAPNLKPTQPASPVGTTFREPVSSTVDLPSVSSLVKSIAPAEKGEICGICKKPKSSSIGRLIFAGERQKFFTVCLDCYINDHRIP